MDGVWSQPGSQEQLQVVCYLQNFLNERAKIETIILVCGIHVELLFWSCSWCLKIMVTYDY